MIKTIIFDWGNTVMKDFDLAGPMKDWDRVEWVAGADEALIALRDRFELVIATSATHSNTEDMILALSRIGADSYFDHFFSSNDLGSSKPDPKFYTDILDILGIIAGETLVVGDKYDKDIEPAKTVGLNTIFYDPSRQYGEFPSADHIIASMRDLPKIMDDWSIPQATDEA